MAHKRKQDTPRKSIIYDCEKCDYTSSIKIDFTDHMKRIHQIDEIFLCNLCKFYCMSNYISDRHNCSHKNTKTYNPPVDLGKYIDIMGSDGNIVFGCTSCPQLFKNRKSVNSHWIRKHPQFLRSER